MKRPDIQVASVPWLAHVRLGPAMVMADRLWTARTISVMNSRHPTPLASNGLLGTIRDLMLAGF